MHTRTHMHTHTRTIYQICSDILNFYVRLNCDILRFGATHLLTSMCAGSGPVAVGGVHEQGEKLDTGGLAGAVQVALMVHLSPPL